MSTTYTPSPTATQSPAGPPASDTLELTLPSDGDALNVASVAQAYKVLADYVAFARAPFANASAYAQPILAFADANLHRRLVVDHFGMRDERLIEWQENWSPAGTFNGTPASPGRWNGVYGGASALNSCLPATTWPVPPLPTYMLPGTSPNAHRTLAMIRDGSAGGTMSLILQSDEGTGAFADDVLASFDLWAQPAEVAVTNWIIGLGSGEAITSFANAVFFAPQPGLPSGGHWQAVSIAGGVATRVTSGVLYNTTAHDFKIVFVGRSLDDGAVAARALFFIDGTLVANITTNLPNNTGQLITPSIGGFGAGGVNNPVLLVGPMKYRQLTAVLGTP